MIRRLYRVFQDRTANLWSLIAPPTIWAAHFMFCYVFAAVGCAKRPGPEVMGDVRLAVGAATVIALLLAAPFGLAGWAQARVPGDPPPHQDSTDEDRQRFLGLAKMMLAGLSVVAILYTAIPAFMFPDCR
jgi:hypothetical protein